MLAKSPSTPEAPTASFPPPPLRLLPGGANPVPGRDFHPQSSSAFPRRTCNGDLYEAAGAADIRRVVYEGQVEVLEKEQLLPLDSVVHADLIRRIRELGVGKKWVFQSRAGTPINSGNVRRRFLHPAAAAVGVKIGGWHDFRHTYRAMMRELNISLEEQRTLMRHSDIQTTLGYGGKTPADVGRPANAKVVEMLRKRA